MRARFYARGREQALGRGPVQRGIRQRVALQVNVRQVGQQLIQFTEGPGPHRLYAKDGHPEPAA
jgi:hypothetical protein